MFDTDKDGEIGMKEIENIIEAVNSINGKTDAQGENSPNHCARFIMNKLDKSNNRTLSEDEFVNGKIKHLFDYLRILY